MGPLRLFFAELERCAAAHNPLNVAGLESLPASPHDGRRSPFRTQLGNSYMRLEGGQGGTMMRETGPTGKADRRTRPRRSPSSCQIEA